MIEIIIAHVIIMGIFAFFLCHSIYIGPRYKEIESSGKQIKGKVEKIKYIRNKFFMKTGACNLSVSFEVESEKKILTALSILDDYKYSVGDEIDLLYLENYPKLVIVEGVPSKAKWQIVAFVLMIVVIAVSMGFSAHNAFERNRRAQEMLIFLDELPNLLEQHTQPPQPPALLFHSDAVEAAMQIFFTREFDKPPTIAEKLEAMQNFRHLDVRFYEHIYWNLTDFPRLFPNTRLVSLHLLVNDVFCAEFFAPLAELENLRGISVRTVGLTPCALEFFESLELDYIHVRYDVFFENAHVEVARAGIEKFALLGENFTTEEMASGEIFEYVRVIENGRAYELFVANSAEEPYFYWLLPDDGTPTKVFVSQYENNERRHISTLEIPHRVPHAGAMAGLIITDIDFDGASDVVVLQGRLWHRAGRTYAGFVYRGGRYEQTNFGDIIEPKLDPVRGRILEPFHGGMQVYGYWMFFFDGEEFAVSDSVGGFIFDNSRSWTITKRNGEEVHEEFPWHDPACQEQDDLQAEFFGENSHWGIDTDRWQDLWGWRSRPHFNLRHYGNATWGVDAQQFRIITAEESELDRIFALYESVLRNEIPFSCSWFGQVYLENAFHNYHIIPQIAVVDLNGDGIPEVIACLFGRADERLILTYYNGEIFSTGASIRTMGWLNTDGTFSVSFGGAGNWGISRYEINQGEFKHLDIYTFDVRQYDGRLVFSVNGAEVSEEEFETIEAAAEDWFAAKEDVIFHPFQAENIAALWQCNTRAYAQIGSGDNFCVSQIFENPQWYSRYEIICNNGEIVFSHATSHPAWFTQICEDILQFSVSAGTNIRWSRFYSTNANALSDAFNNVEYLSNGKIAYINWLTSNEWKIVVRDIFDTEIMYREFPLSDLAPGKRATSSTYLTYLGGGVIKIASLAYGDNFDESVTFRF